jgi:hypothetical protein
MEEALTTYAVYRRWGNLRVVVDTVHHPVQQMAFMLALRRQSKAYADAGIICPAFQVWEAVTFYVEEVS